MPHSAFDIRIRKETADLPVSTAALKRHTAAMLRALGLKKAGLSMLLVGERKMRGLNRRYLAHDWATDVLAFGQTGGPQVKKGMPFLGDLVICPPVARRQAKLYGNTPAYEFLFYVCHGILHLKGYDDHRRKDARRMDRLQKKILKQIGVKNAAAR